MATFGGKVAPPLDLPHMNTIPVQAPSLLIHVCGLELQQHMVAARIIQQ